jgi:hypothetical protein
MLNRLLFLLFLQIRWASTFLATPPQQHRKPRATVGTALEAMRRRSFVGGAAFSLLTAGPPLPAFAGVDVSGLRVEGQAAAPTGSSTGDDKSNTIVLAGISFTPAAMILQLAEQTASMEGMMKESAKEMTTLGLSRSERERQGSIGEGPGVISRADLVKSVDLMVQNSKMSTIAPAAAVTLTAIPRLMKQQPPANGNDNNGGGIGIGIGIGIGKGSGSGDSDLSAEEYLAVGRVYEAAREDLRKAFEAMSDEEKDGGRKIVRAIRAKDEARRREMEEKEMEELRRRIDGRNQV